MSSLAGAVEVEALGVAEYAARIGSALRRVGPALVEGEVQKPRQSGRGLLYFDLADGDARLACKVWPQDLRRLEHRPREGDLVRVVVDRPDLFAQSGKLDLVVSRVQLAGEGELLRRRQELLRRLEGEGLCDVARRTPLPAFPRAVGVISGAGSDGMADVLRALRDRFPPVRIVTCAALVQGARAPHDLIDALAHMQGHPSVDVVIVARGGGSVQDLVAFDDERLCRGIFACRLPVIAAIGHTDNVPVCNHVAWAAFTPSRSAELAVRSGAELRGGLEWAEHALAAVAGRLGTRAERLEAVARRVDARTQLGALELELARRTGALQLAEAAFLGARERALVHAAALLAGVPRRVPGPASLDHVAQVLRTRGRAFFVARGEGLDDTARELTGIAGGLDARRRLAAEQAARVRTGIRRQLTDHDRDYGRAVARLLGQIGGSMARALALQEERVTRERGLVGERARRRLERAERDLRHGAQVVEARDFRRRGWLLASDATGRPLAIAASVRAGDRVDLHFQDGEARTTVDKITHHEEHA